MNTEVFVIGPSREKGIYFNISCGFRGSLEEAKTYAKAHHYAGGVQIATRKKGEPGYDFTNVGA